MRTGTCRTCGQQKVLELGFCSTRCREDYEPAVDNPYPEPMKRIRTMTDTKAPERIWAHQQCGTWLPHPEDETEDVIYIRADLVQRVVHAWDTGLDIGDFIDELRATLAQEGGE